jgi:AAA domain-containing protein
VSALDEAELDEIAASLPGERPHLSVLPPGPDVDWDGIAEGAGPEATPRPGAADRPEPERLDVMTKPERADEWGVAEGFLRPNVLAVAAASPGGAKSWVRAELAMRAATGRGALFDRYAIAHTATVLVVDEDNGDAEEWRRDEAMLAHLGLERRDLSRVYRLSLAGVLLDDPTWQRYLEERIDALGVTLLVLDPISMMHRGKELREELMPVVRYLRALLRRFPALTILAVHHLKKPIAGGNGERGVDDVRGGVWGQVADVIAVMSPLGDRRVKWQLLKRVPSSTLILEQTEAGPLVFVADGAGRARQATNDDRVLAAVDAGATAVEEVVVATGMKERTAWDAVRRLRKAGILERQGELRRSAE